MLKVLFNLLLKGSYADVTKFKGKVNESHIYMEQRHVEMNLQERKWAFFMGDEKE